MKEKFSFISRPKISLNTNQKLIKSANNHFSIIFFSISFIFFSVIYLANPANTKAEYDLPADMATQELQCYKALGQYAFEYYPFNRIYHRNFYYSYKFHDTGNPFYDLQPDQPPYTMTFTSQPTAMIYYSSVYDQNIDSSQKPLIHWGDGTTTQVPYFEIDCSNYGTNAFGEVRYARVFPGFTTTHTYTCNTSINDHYTNDPNINNYYLRVSGKEDDTWNGTDHNGAYIYGDEIIDFSSACNEPPQQAPTVSAGNDLSGNTSNDITLAGTATDDGQPGPLTITWSKVSGPGAVAFLDPHTAQTTAQFENPGTYVLRLEANDGELTRTDEVEVRIIDHYRVEFKSWIPHVSVADPFILESFRFDNDWIPYLGGDVRACLETAAQTGTPKGRAKKQTDITGSFFLGDGHADYGTVGESDESDYRILSVVEFDFDGSEISNFTQGHAAGLTTRDIMVTVADGSVMHCPYSHRADTSVIPQSTLTDGTSFDIFVKGTDPLAPRNVDDMAAVCPVFGPLEQACRQSLRVLKDIPVAPALDGEASGTVHPDGNITFTYKTDAFPSYGLAVERNGFPYMSPVIVDASCLEGQGSIGAANVLIGLQTLFGTYRIEGAADRNSADKPCDPTVIPAEEQRILARILRISINKHVEPFLMVAASNLPRE